MNMGAGVSRGLVTFHLSISTVLVVGLLAVLGACASGNNPVGYGQSLVQVESTGDQYRVTFPLSAVALRFPKQGFVRSDPGFGGGTAHPAYFYMDNRATGLTLSGWFITYKLYPGIEAAFWEGQKSPSRPKDLPEAKNVSFGKVGMWDVVFYALSGPNMRASCVYRGTWVDLHLSFFPADQGNYERLMAFLASVKLEEAEIQPGWVQSPVPVKDKTPPPAKSDDVLQEGHPSVVQ
jgi:hypothetical protein